ncbi:hypothetical protein EXIGLDRAFT_335607 [Exidia glandulosa HHB12029]|uniref:Fe2OG dioxygenase domain-containing protein n=1 Tax=Exidia glandulosa HHB12029 TaxID=1314781 RepID=A0A165CMQ1_EXIGL|nr:hypothetical protein EXIGLDRAFT_335607 [Exidia glandulosa HHB12029]
MLHLSRAEVDEAKGAYDAFRAEAARPSRKVVYERPQTKMESPARDTAAVDTMFTRRGPAFASGSSRGGSSVPMVNGVPVASLPSSAPVPVQELPQPSPEPVATQWPAVKPEPVDDHLPLAEATRQPTIASRARELAESSRSRPKSAPLPPSTPPPPPAAEGVLSPGAKFQADLLAKLGQMNSPQSSVPSRVTRPPSASARSAPAISAAVPTHSSRNTGAVASSSRTAAPKPAPGPVLGKRKRQASSPPSTSTGVFMRRKRKASTPEPELWSDEYMVREFIHSRSHTSVEIVKPEDESLDDMNVVETPVLPRTWRSYDLPLSEAPPKWTKDEDDPRPPLPHGLRPFVWSKTRQEICETLPWFKSYQGGVYSKGGLTRGYLFGQFPSPRDAFIHDGRVLISHGGGGSALVDVEVDDEDIAAVTLAHAGDNDHDDVDGEKPGVDSIDDNAPEASTSAESPRRPKKKVKRALLTKDQSARKGQVNPLRNAMLHQHPILLLADKRWKLFPYNLGERWFVVLGWYWIKDSWEEPELTKDSDKGYNLRTKLLFQWVDAQGEPWWLRQPSPARPVLKPDPDASHVQHPTKVYAGFLGNQTEDPADRKCTKCRQPAKAIFSQGWMCLNTVCQAYWRLVDVPDGSQPSPYGDGMTYNPAFVAPTTTPQLLLARCKVETYCPRQPAQSQLRGFWCERCGKVTCRIRWETWECDSCKNAVSTSMPLQNAAALQPSSGLAFDADVELQEGVISMQRYTLVVDNEGHVAVVHRFTFPFNRGVIYHIMGNSAINAPVDAAFAQCQTEFAEQPFLRRQYLESHKTGPTALLTQYFSQNFGAPYKFAAETDTNVPFDSAPGCIHASLAIINGRARRVDESTEFNEVLVAAYLDGQQMHYHSDFEAGLRDDIATLSMGSPALMKFRLVSPSKGKKHPTCLSLTLSHGDVLVMHGVGIQQYYQHMVAPAGFRIAATARYIEQTAPP